MSIKRQTDKSLLSLAGVQENNLKNLDLTLVHNSLTAITGVSGSGKSTLAFDTIYAEGGRRYIETFSPYTRQFLQRLHQPNISSIAGLRPALALEQVNRTTASRSTVGTITEINDYLKVIWSQFSTVVCDCCHEPVSRDNIQQVISTVAKATASTKELDFLAVGFEVNLGSATADSLRLTLQAEGFVRFFDRAKNEIRSIETLSSEDLKNADGTLLIVADRIRISDGEKSGDFSQPTVARLCASISQAYQYGHGKLSFLLMAKAKGTPQILNFFDSLRCRSCGKEFAYPIPAAFSFNSPIGACDNCKGFGKVLAIDEALCIPNPTKTLRDGAIVCWNMPSTKPYFRKLQKFCQEKEIDLDTPWEKLPRMSRKIIFEGSAKDNFRGVAGWYRRLERKKYKMHVRMFLSLFRGEFLCQTCNGTRLKPSSLLYKINNKSISEIWQMSIGEALGFFVSLKTSLPIKAQASLVLDEVISRLSYISDIGLSYLTLDRQSRTLSGGEFQRISLTAILGSRLVSTILVLDEPTIGLHARDNDRLVTALKKLKERGNTVLLVEHDPKVIAHADEIIDLGPAAGSSGGNIVFQGPTREITQCQQSLTGKYLSGELFPKRSLAHVSAKKAKYLEVIGCRANNLKDIDLRVPLNGLVVLTGVSGSGKSSLINECLFQTYDKLAERKESKKSKWTFSSGPVREFRGLDNVDEIVLVDQSPVGKTPRSNPATYTKAWDIVREALAKTNEAQRLSLGKSAFSFNVDGGRCPDCKGAGSHRVEMQFLADVFVECETCCGLRFKDQVLSVSLNGKNVIDLLNLSISDAVELFSSLEDTNLSARFKNLVHPLVKLGLDYLRLGQPLNQLSGGEAQRLKLASYLSTENKHKCLFILDEPTTGLHPHNISQLLATFDELLAHGHSLLVVEHNLDVIRQADWIIDLGPEGGDAGGEIVTEGTPQSLIAAKRSNVLSHTAMALQESEQSEKFVSPSNKSAKECLDLSQLLQKNPANNIEVLGARHHNLRNINVSIPKHKLTVVTGVSGSGKSTLAFDIIFSEGQRRYIDCLSPYARQFIKQLERPDVDLVDSLPPTVALSQKTAPPLGISTVATTTEIYQYLRLLFSKAGTLHCPEHKVPISVSSAENITEEIIEKFGKQRIFLFAPAVSGRKGHYNELFNRALRAELVEARIDGGIKSLTPDLRLDRHKLHWISLLVGSVGVPARNRELLTHAVTQCLLLGDNVVEVSVGKKDEEPILFSTERVCPQCKRGFRALDPQDFSFRSKRGMCTCCEGRGRISPRNSREESIVCPECKGSRIGELGRNVLVGKSSIFEMTSMTAPQLRNLLQSISFSPRLLPVVRPLLRELTHKLSMLEQIGLGYLSLNRESSTVSGGEAQRLRLARALGSPLSGICYILDEPTIGLHPSDHAELMRTLFSLRDQGNTLLVVEHDEETIRAADYVIDVGPRGGAQGGHLLCAGTVDELMKTEDSLTAQALLQRENGQRQFARTSGVAGKSADFLRLAGITANNLKNISVTFPLGMMTVVAGVSGAGKSSLVNYALAPAITEVLQSKKTKKNESSGRTWKAITGYESLEKLVIIDQSPVGKTSASSPASFLEIFTDIRKLYAQVPEAGARGWGASHFSFNSGKGRCTVCEGKGYLKIPMSFLPDALSVCEQCHGKRYDQQTLEILYQGNSIGELLQRTVAEAKEILSNHPRIRHTLDHVVQLGLGYLTLGQPTHTLSGGELQRLKIARELGARTLTKTLYIIDEPTTGLHMTDVDKLISVVGRLTQLGNTVVIIEHNLDVISAADYLIELGPGPAEKGGNVIFHGSPAELINGTVDTPTKRYLKNEVYRTPANHRAIYS